MSVGAYFAIWRKGADRRKEWPVCLISAEAPDAISISKFIAAAPDLEECYKLALAEIGRLDAVMRKRCGANVRNGGDCWCGHHATEERV